MSKVRIAAGLLVCAGGMLWAQFYESMQPELRSELAEDYYLAGSRYKAVGLETKGQEFQDLAFVIDPGLDPESISDPEPVSIEEYLASADVRVLGPPDEDRTAALIRSRFLRLTGALIMEDPVSVLQNVEGSVYLSDLRVELSARQLHDELRGLFDSVSLRGLPPSQVYDLGSLEIQRLPEQQTRSWGATYSAQIDSRMDLSSNVPIWTEQQRFYLRKSQDGRWLIFAAGRSLPPSWWHPLDAGDLSALVAPEPTVAETTKEVEQSFLSCLEQFLAEDTEGALDHVARSVVLERLNVVVTREEVGATFEGYFESSDFGALRVPDIVDEESLFVSVTDKYPEVGAGDRYLLTVKTRLDLSDTIPFWTRFQEYYFTLEDGAWRIFAIF